MPGIRFRILRAVACAALTACVVTDSEAIAQTTDQAASAKGDLELPTIEVTAVKKKPKKKGVSPESSSIDSETAYGPLDGYNAAQSASGTKTDTPLRETPQSVTVIGRDQIKDQGAQTLQDTLRYVPGVTADLYGEDSRNDGFAIRGQETTIQFLDGLARVYGNYLNASPIEPYMLERIEVLKGPSAVLYGQSGVGGTVNMISRRPEAQRNGEFGVQYGSHDSKQATLDMTGALSDDGKWLYRLTGLARDADTIVDMVERKRFAVQPALTYRPDTNTSLTMIGQLGRDRGGNTAQFLPLEGTLFRGPNGRIPRSRFTGEPDFDRYDSDYWSLSFIGDHRFNDIVSVHQGLRYSDTAIDYAQIYPYKPDPFNPFLDPDRQLIGRDMTMSKMHTRTLVSDSNITSKFNLGETSHKLLAGMDFSRSHVTGKRGFATDCNPFNLYNPQYGNFQICDFDLNPLPEFPLEKIAGQTQQQTGLYIQDQMRYGPWIAVIGARHDWARNAIAGEAVENAKAFTRRAGLMYELPFGLTPFASYAESFVPASGSDRSGKPFEPLRGKSLEGGIKYQVPDGNFTVQASAYSAREKNRLLTDPVDPSFSEQTGEVSLKGFEFEAKGNITPNIRLVAGYAYTDAKYIKGEPNFITGESQDGKRVESIPKHTASLNVVYAFNEGRLEGLSLGAGVRYFSGSWDGYDQFKTPSYTLFDAMIGYETRTWRFALNASNLADTYVVNTCLYYGDCFLGAGREITASLTRKF